MNAANTRIILIGEFFLSLGSLAIIAGSLSTQQWVTGEVRIKNHPSQEKGILIHYGLFGGLRDARDAGSIPSSIYLVCCEGCCMYSTLNDKEGRLCDLDDLMHNSAPTVTVPQKCKRVDGPSRGPEHRSHEVGFSDCLRQGMLYTTVAFLVLALILILVTAAVTMYNVMGKPIDFMMTIPSLPIWNGMSALSILMTIILWGSEFSIHIVSNIMVRLTIVKETYTSQDTAWLGFSYWMLFGCLGIHIINILLILYRQFAIEKKRRVVQPKNSNKRQETNMLY